MNVYNRQGYDAYWKGVHVNPHSVNTYSWNAWADGWRLAYSDDCRRRRVLHMALNPSAALAGAIQNIEIHLKRHSGVSGYVNGVSKGDLELYRAALSHAPLPTVAVTEERFQAAKEAYRQTSNYPIVPANHDDALKSALTAALSQGEGNSRDEVLESAAQIAGDACWSLPMPKHWDRDKDEYSDWCAAQSKFMREKILALKSPSQT